MSKPSGCLKLNRRQVPQGRMNALCHVNVIDEIGPMEILSPRFRQAVLDVLESPVRVLCTIVRRSIPYTDALKARSNVKLINVQLDNREQLVQDLIAQLSPGRFLA